MIRSDRLWTRMTRVALASATATTTVGLIAAPATAHVWTGAPSAVTDSSPVRVIVGYDPAIGPGAAEAAITAAGGAVTRRLDIADSVAATLPSNATASVRGAVGVTAVTGDGAVHLQGARWQAGTDLNSMYSVNKSAGVPDVWSRTDSTGRRITGKELNGEKDIMGRAWVPGAWSTASRNGTAWTAGTYNGATWAGGAWTSNSLGVTTRTGVAWSGSSWAGRTWSGRTWSAGVWDGRTWSGANWSGRTWSGRTWSGNYWSGQDWK